MWTQTAFDRALCVEVYDGEVVIRSADGPTGLSLTARAAAETAEQLAKAARIAALQASQTSAVRD